MGSRVDVRGVRCCRACLCCSLSALVTDEWTSTVRQVAVSELVAFFANACESNGNCNLWIFFYHDVTFSTSGFFVGTPGCCCSWVREREDLLAGVEELCWRENLARGASVSSGFSELEAIVQRLWHALSYRLRLERSRLGPLQHSSGRTRTFCRSCCRRRCSRGMDRIHRYDDRFDNVLPEAYPWLRRS